MVRIKGPLNHVTARGWLGRYMYQTHGVVKNPYPISFLGKIHIPYPIPAFGLHPYPQFIAQYYSVKGWAYQMRRTWHGLQPVAMRPPDHNLPATPDVLAGQVLLKEAVGIWQGMNQQTKSVYNSWRNPVQASGYNKFISWYLRTTTHMPIYWGTLQRTALDNRTIEDKMVDQDAPTIRYPFNFRQYQLFNMVVHKGAGFPENPVQGQLFYREDEEKLYKFDDPAWAEVGGGVGGGHTIQQEMSSLPARTYLNFYGLGVQGGDDPGNDRTNIYIPKFADIDTRVATVVVAIDGSGDFTDIQDGIDALPSEGGLVFVKNGTYTISAGLVIAKSNVTLEGQGASTLFQAGVGLNDYILKIGDGASSYSKINIKGIRFDGNKANQASGYNIYILDKVDDVIIEGNYIENAYTGGVLTGGTNKRLKITNNHFTGNNTQSIAANSSDYLLIQANNFVDDAIDTGNIIDTTRCNHVRIIGNLLQDTSGMYRSVGINFTTFNAIEENYEIIGNTFAGLKYTFTAVTMFQNPRKMTIIGNTIKDIQYDGIATTGTAWMIIGNTIDDVGGHGINCSSANSIIKGNIIRNCDRSGIYIATSGVVCIGNQIESIQHYGILLEWATQNLISGNWISNIGLNIHNTFSGISLQGENGAPSSQNSIYDNFIIGPTYGNRKAYSIREYTAYTDYNLVRGNIGRQAIQGEIIIRGVNSEAFDNETYGP